MHCTCAPPEPRHLGEMANGRWLGLIHSSSRPVWEEQRESIILPHWLFLVSKSGKMLLVFIFFDLSEISVLC